MAGAPGRGGAAVFDTKRLGDETLQAETVDLQVRLVGHRGQELDVQVMDAVGGDRQVVGLGQARDLEPDRDPAAVRQGERLK